MKFSPRIRGRTRSLTHVLRAGIFFWFRNEISERPVIVVGAPNSGTTMFARALNLHPELANRSEERVLWNPRFHHSDMASDYFSAHHATAWRKFVLKGNFAYFHRRFKGKRIVNKHPENSLRLEFIKEIFPEAYYIHLLRDGRAVVNSNLGRRNSGVPFANWVLPPDWEDFADSHPVEQFAYMWKSCVDSIQSVAPNLANFREIRYEDLAENQDKIFRELFKWLQVTVDEELINKMPRIENRNFKWKEKLSEKEIAMIQKFAGDTLQRNGYAE